MVSYNIVCYYNMEYVYGLIVIGRIVNINILESKENLVLISVFVKGKWVKCDGVNIYEVLYIDWSKYKVILLLLDWFIEKEDMIFFNKMGIYLLNNVIIKLYISEINIDCDELFIDYDECFFMMIVCDGSW